MKYKMNKKKAPLQVAGKRAFKALGANCGCEKKY
tara:strand:+ start:433 stop:534 length:102 start_codon:yes stop_codon:yes gene_type:complete